jgi:nonsense-mediated mRNA decay protein 3
MSERRQLCPRCGDPLGPVDIDQRVARDPSGRGADLCDACYFEGFDLVDAPDRVEVPVCTSCGAVGRGESWVDVGARDYTDVAVEAVSEALSVHIDAEEVSWEVRPEQVDETTIRMHAGFTGVVRETPVREEHTVPVKISGGTCNRCGRIAGDYYAATVQVRATNRTPDDDEIDGAREIARSYVADRERKGDRNAFISRMETTDEGLNVRVSTTQIGRAIASRVVDRFGGTVSDSRRLITEDGDGNRVYRMTYAIRLPPYRPGDVVDPGDGDGPVLVTSVRGNLKGKRLRSGDRYEADGADGIDPDAVRLGTAADGAETTLVTVEDDRAVQVLDPETYHAETVARPDYLDPDAETVTVFKSRAGLHVLPEDRPTDGNEDENGN